MIYIKVAWIHKLPKEPVLYFHEIGKDGHDTRRVQFYRDGSSEWANEDFETATAGLAEITFPPAEEISTGKEFIATEIDHKEFHRAWSEARSNSRNPAES